MRKTSAQGEVPTDTHFASAEMSHLLAQGTTALKGAPVFSPCVASGPPAIRAAQGHKAPAWGGVRGRMFALPLGLSPTPPR